MLRHEALELDEPVLRECYLTSQAFGRPRQRDPERLKARILEDGTETGCEFTEPSASGQASSQCLPPRLPTVHQ